MKNPKDRYLDTLPELDEMLTEAEREEIAAWTEKLREQGATTEELKEIAKDKTNVDRARAASNLLYLNTLPELQDIEETAIAEEVASWVDTFREEGTSEDELREISEKDKNPDKAQAAYTLLELSEEGRLDAEMRSYHEQILDTLEDSGDDF